MHPPDEGVLTASERRLREKVANDPSLHEVAGSLPVGVYSEFNVDPLDLANDYKIISFLSRALHLPGLWEFLNSSEYRDRAARRKALAKATRALKTTLTLNERLATWYLAPAAMELSEGHSVGVKRLADLNKSVHDILDHALHWEPELPPDILSGLSRTHAIPNARERFFVRSLAQLASALFKTPHFREVGLMATVCLGLQQEMSADEAQELFRRRP